MTYFMVENVEKTPKQDLPVSQLEPSYPMLQEHVYFSNLSVHIPPFLQGMLAHLSNSRIKLTKDEIMAAITTQGLFIHDLYDA